MAFYNVILPDINFMVIGKVTRLWLLTFFYIQKPCTCFCVEIPISFAYEAGCIAWCQMQFVHFFFRCFWSGTNISVKTVCTFRLNKLVYVCLPNRVRFKLPISNLIIYTRFLEFSVTHKIQFNSKALFTRVLVVAAQMILGVNGLYF